MVSFDVEVDEVTDSGIACTVTIPSGPLDVSVYVMATFYVDVSKGKKYNVHEVNILILHLQPYTTLVYPPPLAPPSLGIFYLYSVSFATYNLIWMNPFLVVCS